MDCFNRRRFAKEVRLAGLLGLTFLIILVLGWEARNPNDNLDFISEYERSEKGLSPDPPPPGDGVHHPGFVPLRRNLRVPGNAAEDASCSYDIRKRQAEPTVIQEMEKINAAKTRQDDPSFVKFVRRNFIMDPNNKPYNLNSKNVSNPSDGQLQSVLHFFEDTNHSSAFFIELGAWEGEWISNTLYLEKELGWNGLLIEAEPKSFTGLLKKNRKSWMSNACVSVYPYPVKTVFYRNLKDPYVNGLTYRRKHQVNDKMDIQCIPLYTMLLALKRTVIDFFSLDVEGSELAVLRTIPFDKVVFKILAVEVEHVEEGVDAVKELMFKHGYTLFTSVYGGRDLVFTYPEAFKPGFKYPQ